MTTQTIQPPPEGPEFPWLRRFSKLLAVATIALIFVGGQVKSHEAGLSIPDWPTSYGQNMLLYPLSEWNGGIFYEQSHRVVAFSVGVMSVLLCGWLLLRESRRWVKALGLLAVGGVIAQGVLGGLTVLFVQPAWLSSLHGVVAQSFLMLVVLVAYTQSRERARRERTAGKTLSLPSAMPILAVVAIVFIQLIVGAFMRHTESGLAIPDFPLMAGGVLPWFTAESVEWVNTWRVDYAFETGRVLPEVTLSQIWVHFAHRVGAALVLLSVAYALIRAFRDHEASPHMWRGTMLLVGLVATQAALGITTVLTQKVPLLTSLHVVTGAAILGYATLLTLRALPLSWGTRRLDRPSTAVGGIAAQKVQI